MKFKWNKLTDGTYNAKIEEGTLYLVDSPTGKALCFVPNKV